MNQKGSTLVIAVLAGLAILAGLLVIFHSRNLKINTPNSSITSPVKSSTLPIVSSTPDTTPTIQPLAFVQGRCQTGYYFYENDAYSICYPAGWNYQGTKNFFDSVGEVKDQVSFTKDGGKESLDIYPSAEIAAGGPNPCEMSEKVNVSGHSATRDSMYDSLSKGCSSTIEGIQTLITEVDMSKMGVHLDAPGYNPFTINYEIYQGGKPVLTKQQYIVIEQSLQFK